MTGSRAGKYPKRRHEPNIRRYVQSRYLVKRTVRLKAAYDRAQAEVEMNRLQSDIDCGYMRLQYLEIEDDGISAGAVLDDESNMSSKRGHRQLTKQ